jgi:acetylornithine deacetylase/succinyl-diaminopimelate desuccinylase family protein
MSKLNKYQSIIKEINREKVEKLISDLVKIRSPWFEEEEITEFVKNYLGKMHLNPWLHEVSDEKITKFKGNNVIAEVGNNNGPNILLNAHMDTVKICNGWKRDPLGAQVEGNKLYGQGALDMKSGLAAAMIAIELLKTIENKLKGKILFTAVVDEEGPYGLGTDALIRDGITDSCDMAIVTEPAAAFAPKGVNNPCLLIGARGRYLYEIKVKGKSAHGAMPYLGVNALVDASKVVLALEKMKLGSHPFLGEGSLCVLKIEGGGETISVPDRSRILADRHVIVGETEEQVKKDAEEIIEKLNLKSKVEVGFRDAPYPEVKGYGAYITPKDHIMVKEFENSFQELTGQKPALSSFMSIGDFNYLGDKNRANLPTIIIGADGDNVHSPEEYVDLKDATIITKVLTGGLINLLCPE